ncbi:MAG TPA: FAD-binding oxidoreductase [Candidatus Acidoferrales bacterium]|nr:FAD-binding oxidoreductase [Candidatus Acidoferrales bacterium]
MRVPPGVSPGDFAAALKRFEEAVGKEWVFTSDEDIDTYRDSYSPFWHENEEPIPSAAVAPDGVEQVQKIARIANTYKIPLWTISTGKNLGYGGSAPLLGGSVVLDLKRMNRILEVNDKNHYALVEPGVSYFDLYHYVQEKGLNVWIDPPDPGWGSLVGNALERGGGYTPMRDHFDAHCGMEVVLANGEVVRTGMGALPNSKTWQQYKYGFGPYVDGIFSQSNLGIVTKMGFWLYPPPEAYLSGNVVVSKHDDLFALVEIFANLMNSGMVQATTTVVSPLAFARPDAELAAARASGSTRDLEQYAARKNIGYWSVSLPFYGPAKVVAAQWEHAKEKFSVILGVKFQDGASYRFPLDADQLAKITNPVPFGVPSLQTFSIGGPRSQGHMWFSPIIPMTGEAVLEAQEVFAQVYRDLGSSNSASAAFPVWNFFARAFVIIYFFPIEHDVEKNKRNREIFRRLVKTSAERGWGEYRTHTAFMGDIMDAYSFNNHALLRLHETMKDALDPNGILSPGKNGIWPKGLRKAKA